MIYSKIVANKLNVKNTLIKHPRNIYEKYFIKKIKLIDGMASEHLWSLPLSDFLKDKKGVIFDGLAGDLILKGLFLDAGNYKYINDNKKICSTLWNQCGYNTLFIRKFFNKDISLKIKNGKESLKSEIYNIPINENKISIFFAKNRTKNGLSLISNNIFGNFIKRFPFLENNLVNFGFSIPPEIKINKHIYYEILKKSFPEIMKIPTTNDKTLFIKIDSIFWNILTFLKIQNITKTIFKNIFFRKLFKQKEIR
jgi:hypothetical protein